MAKAVQALRGFAAANVGAKVKFPFLVAWEKTLENSKESMSTLWYDFFLYLF